MRYTAPVLERLTASNLPIPHAFFSRVGGRSEGPFQGLNLGLSSGDRPEKVAANRDMALSAFGASRATTCAFHQVHSARVLEAEPSWFELEADAAVTDNPDLLLVISVADCFPLLFFDARVPAVGAAHCGWRGTVKGIAGAAVEKMTALYGSRPEDIRVAIGPGIRRDCYQVGAEVVAAFKEAGFPTEVAVPDDEGRFRLDLAVANRWLLTRVGVKDEHVEDLGLCTHCEPSRFYSYRRDHGVTGRHWAVIRLPNPDEA